MAVSSPIAPFLWGNGGAMLSPEQVARDREIAAALVGNSMDYSPVDHWLQGAARAAQGLVGGLKDRWATEAETSGREGFQSRWDDVFGGGQRASPSAMQAPAQVTSVPTSADATAIRQGLINRGLPDYVADAFVMNFQDESGLNPGINEAAPLVPGSRGGFGLYQLTGPRRTAYEQYAAQQGVDPANVDAQLDFMMSELHGPEASAYRSIMAAPDTGSAAAAIVNEFLRPAETHRARRAAAYMGGAVPQVAQGSTPDIAALLGLASDPWANETQRSIINSLVGRQLDQQAQANDPLRQLQIERAMLENEALRNPVVEQPKPIEVGGVLLDPVTFEPIFDSRQTGGSGLINAGDGNIYDPSTGEWITAPSSAEPPLTDTQRNLSWRAEQAGLVPGTPEYAEFMRSGGQGGGMALSVGPDGAVQFTQGGAGGKPLTEAQSKDTLYATRATGALPQIDALEQSLLSFGEYAAGNLPMGLGNYLRSEDYQVASNAGKEFLASILRKDTGAAVTPSEEQLYGDIFLPRPGDKPATLDRKRQARTLALEAIKAGMPPQAIENMARALANAGGEETSVTAPAAQSQPQQITTQEQYEALPVGTPYLAPDGTIRTKR